MHSRLQQVAQPLFAEGGAFAAATACSSLPSGLREASGSTLATGTVPRPRSSSDFAAWRRAASLRPLSAIRRSRSIARCAYRRASVRISPVMDLNDVSAIKQRQLRSAYVDGRSAVAAVQDRVRRANRGRLVLAVDQDLDQCAEGHRGVLAGDLLDVVRRRRG
jgi:hypothetical protein